VDGLIETKRQANLDHRRVPPRSYSRHTPRERDDEQVAVHIQRF
jgi:hypothetical protein